MKRSFAIISALFLSCLLVATQQTAGYGFGSIDLFLPPINQQAEHQHITEVLYQDKNWDKNSVQLVAGNKGNYGGVAAPDRINDTGDGLTGLGPGYKHCDDGDYLEIDGYPQSQANAQANLNLCARYFQNAMNKALKYAGKLVTPDLAVDTSVFTMTSKDTIKPDSVCLFRFSMTPDKNTKCDVINALGRALHLAEDVWAHTNWGDLSDSSKEINADNPPGLGNTSSPAFLRYPASPVVPSNLISGCDDSAGASCKNRVKHSGLAKDTGKVTEQGSWVFDKYPRGAVMVDNVTNFTRVINGAKQQVLILMSDFELALISKYGKDRGQMIMNVIRSDTADSASLSAALVASPEMLSAPMVTAEIEEYPEFAADPTDDAMPGTFNKETDLDHTHLGDEGHGRNAAAAGEDIVAQESANLTSWMIVALLGFTIAVVTGAVVIIRRKKRVHKPLPLDSLE